MTFPSRRPSGDILLEGILSIPDVSTLVGGVVICHPHPMGGGNMEVPLLQVMSSHICRGGYFVLRFNFGGVGESGGFFTGGSEEPYDLYSAIELLNGMEAVDASTTAVIGWSFGAQVLLSSCSMELDVSCAIAIAPPLVMSNMEKLAEQLTLSRTKIIILVGDRDHFSPLKELEMLKKLVPEGKIRRIEVIHGADHFLFGREEEVADLVFKMIADYL